MVVMVHHGLRTLKPDGWAWAASEILLNAHGAVVIFFVLSGYVLSLSLVRRGLEVEGLVTFYVRRAFRIYPALWVAAALGTAYLLLVEPLSAPNLSAWLNGHYRPEDLTAVTIGESLLATSNFLVPTAWTITVELCASLLLPAMVYVYVRRRAWSIPLMLLLAAVGFAAGPALRQAPFYLLDFAFGAALACVPEVRRLRPTRGLMLLALIALAFTELVLPWAQHAWSLTLVEGLASTTLIAGIVSHPPRWMRNGALVAIGDWSYSLYLLHLPIAFAVARIADHAGLVGADRDAAALAIAAATSVLTIPLSAIIYRYVERPGIAAGALLLGARFNPFRRDRVSG